MQVMWGLCRGWDGMGQDGTGWDGELQMESIPWARAKEKKTTMPCAGSAGWFRPGQGNQQS